MNHSEIFEPLKWFKENIELVIEDIDARKKGYAIEIYMDTYIIKEIIIGFNAYYSKETGLSHIFKKDRALITCLASNGWLGPFQMLPPHEAEFFDHLNNDFNIKNLSPSEFEQLVNSFHQSLISENIIKPSDFTLSTAYPEQIVKYLRQNPEFAINIFKMIELVRGDWKQRLIQLREKNILNIDGSFELDFLSIVKTPLYKKIKIEFDKKRKGYSINNMADSLALCILIEKTKNSIAKRRLPRFYFPMENHRLWRW